jgi:inorganic pyrophosphatase
MSTAPTPRSSPSPARDPRYQDLQDLPGIPAHLLAEVSQFFDVYKELEPGKSTDIRGWQDRAAAEQEITAARRRGGSTAAHAGPAS